MRSIAPPTPKAIETFEQRSIHFTWREIRARRANSSGVGRRARICHRSAMPLLFSLLLLLTPLLSQSTSSVEGKVVNSVTGEAVRKAVVNVRSRSGQYVYTAASDQFGKYHVDNVTPEKYMAQANAEGFT